MSKEHIVFLLVVVLHSICIYYTHNSLSFLTLMSVSELLRCLSAVENVMFATTALTHVLLGRFHRYARAEPKFIYHKNKKNEKLMHECKALHNFRPTPLYALDYYGFMQTLGQTVLKSIGRTLSSIEYRRELFVLSDGGTVGLDWVQHVDGHPVRCNKDSPTVIIQHGLCGDSNVEYVIHLAETLSRLHYRVLVMVSRGCGGVKLTTHAPFSFEETLDFKEVVDYVHQLFPQCKLFAVGYSLGACMTLRHTAIYATDTPLSGALCVSPPWDFNVVESFMFRVIWTKVLVAALKLYFWLNRETVDEQLLQRIYSATDMHSYNDIVAPVLGHENRLEYYNASSPKFVTHKICTVPTLAVSSVDDPVCNIYGAPQDVSSGQIGSSLILAVVELGGHLGFAEDWLPYRTSWIDRVCIDWFDTIIKYDLETSVPPLQIY